MKLARRNFLFGLLSLLLFGSGLSAQNYFQDNNGCIEGAAVSVAFTGETEINTCTGDDLSDRVRFQTDILNMAYAYVVVDVNDIIVLIGFSNFINFDMLPTGVLRVYSFSNYGLLTAEVGDDFNTAELAVPCFGLSGNFVTVNNAGPGETTIVSATGETEFNTCPGDGIADVISVSSTGALPNTAFIITDSDNVVLGINETGEIDLDGAGVGVCRIYGFSYGASLDVAVGDDLDDADDFGCGGPSPNFITVTRQMVEGGTVALEGGGTEAQTCPGDGNDDFLSFVSSDASGSNFTYVVTDADGNILGVPPGNEANFEGAGLGACRVYGLAYEGDLLAVEGLNINDDDLASGCNELSDNFITVIREVPVGGDITTTDGETEIAVCPEDMMDDLVTFTVSGTAGGTTTLVVTDADNNILGIPPGNEVNFESAGFGTCRVWNLTYQGELTAMEGDNINDVLATSCTELSANFVNVIRTNPEAGTVATVDGETEIFTCPGDGEADLIGFASTGATGSNTIYVVTDANNVILGLPDGNEVDFEGAGFGACRVWVLSYEGDLLAAADDDLLNTRLATACFTLSDNFVTVNRVDAEGGTVATTDGETLVTTCPGDGVDDIFNFVSTGASDLNFTFVVTDANNNILGIPEGDEANFEGAGTGNCRLWGLSYAGDLLAEMGDNLDIELASGCFDLSDNFVTVMREVPEGGTIATVDGETEIAICPGDMMPDMVSFTSTAASGGTITLVVTDNDNNIIGFPIGSTLDFDGAGFGTCRVWTLVYQGELTAGMDDNLDTELASSCFDLSDNFVTVIRTNPDGGTVATVDGETEVTTCPGDGLDDFISFANTSATGSNLAYVVTDANNNILGLPEGNEVNFEGAGVGACRLWTVAYEGDFLAQMDDLITETRLSTGCFSLSENFVTVNRIEVLGGTVSTTDGETELLTCPGDGVADVFTFSAEGGSDLNFTYVVTDADGNILGVPAGNEVDFEDAGTGACRLYGLTYLGDLLAAMDQNVGEDMLATGCYSLSDNFVNVVREVPTGGTVATDTGNDMVVTCPGDMVDDLVTAVTTGNSGGATAYIITNEDNIILGFPEGNVANLEGAGVGTCRIWSVTYQGEFTAVTGVPLDENDLASSCFALSDNFITVVRNVPTGGTVATADGETEVSICAEDDLADIITVVNEDASASNTAYLVTDENNVILMISEDNDLDFTGAGLGVCRIWTVTYEGVILAQEGDNAAEVRLASGCFSLSDNFITVNRIEIEGGTVATVDGETEVTTCPGDGVEDLFTFVSEGASDLNFTYVVTDGDGVILGFPGATIDFEDAGNGNCRVYGLTYAGELLASPDDVLADVQLATGCNALSENFVTVIRNAPDGGTVSLEGGGTELMTCPGDGVPDIVSVDSTGTSLNRFTYVITDSEGVILSLPFGDDFNLDGAGLGTCRIYGIGYDGTFIGQPGDTVGVSQLATACFTATDNFVSVTRETPAGGTVATEDGETELFVCPLDDLSDVISFDSAGVAGGNFTYIVTDTNNVILGLPAGDFVDFNTAGLGVCRLWGFTYQGNLLAMVGDDADEVQLADGCSSLSDNFVTVTREDVMGGTVSTTSGSNSITTCPGDGIDDIIFFTSDGAQGGGFVYLITDDNNIVLGTVDGNSQNFEDAGEGACRVWGLSFAGDLSVEMGDDAAMDALATGCFSLSSNFVTIIRTQPEGGTVSVEGMEDPIMVCSGDSDANELVFTAAGASDGNYLYVVTQENFVLAALPDSVFDFNNAQPGTYQVHGLAFAGSPSFIPGDPIFDANLATSCFDLSDNFITIEVERVDGCEITASGASGNSVFLCPQNPNDGVVQFSNCSDVVDGNYVYVIATPEDVILVAIEGDEFDFGALPFPVARVYGISYTGNLNNLVGTSITGELSDGCYAVSDNFISIVNSQPEAGEITLAEGTGNPFCVANGNGEVVVETTSTSMAGYVIIVTDESDIVLSIQDPSGVDVGDLPQGNYRFYGLSYTGVITIEVGDDINLVALADNCFALTTDFIDFERGDNIEGGTISNQLGTDLSVFCPANGDAPLVLVSSTITGVPYRYLVTDENGIIQIPDVFSNVINFNGGLQGGYRIYGYAFSGNVTATFGAQVETAMLSDSCFALSENFITVIYEDANGGTVATDEGETEVSIDITSEETTVDVVSADASTANSFIYLITDENNIVLGMGDGPTFDFADAGTGDCRIWGLSYQGDLSVAMGDDAGASDLATGCFDLSDNFVTVTRTEGDGAQEEEEEESVEARMSITPYPNPVNGDQLRVIFASDEPLTQGQAFIRDQNGRAWNVQEVMGGSTTTVVNFNISNLPTGLFVVQYRAGDRQEVVRFIRQ